MRTHYDNGLISQHLWKFYVLALKPLERKDLKAEVKTIVAQALEQFDIRSTRDPTVNRVAFKGKLKYMAEITPSRQAEQKEALEYAASLIPDESRLEQSRMTQRVPMITVDAVRASLNRNGV
jgi:hypothetical protein